MIPNYHNFPSKLFWSSLLVPIFIIISQSANAAENNQNHDPHSYVHHKLKIHDIVFLGTRHKQQPILGFISDLIPKLKESGVTHIGLETASDQQNIINKFINTGSGLSVIQIQQQIDCSEYRNLFTVLRALEATIRPTPIAIDLPKSNYNESISRDGWMAKCIAKIFQKNPNAKMLVIVGNNHVLKKLDWQDHVPNPHRSIREYLSEKRSNLRIFSIGQIIGNSIYECDFRKKFSGIDGAVALDLDERFTGWKMGIIQLLAIKPVEVWELLDGVIVY
jgi:hypothetical protein